MTLAAQKLKKKSKNIKQVNCYTYFKTDII